MIHKLEITLILVKFFIKYTVLELDHYELDMFVVFYNFLSHTLFMFLYAICMRHMNFISKEIMNIDTWGLLASIVIWMMLINRC